jgi:CRISPR-associated protein Cmr2
MVDEMIESPRELALKMRLQAGEQLCAVGLTKRLGGRRADQMKKDEKVMLEVFPSVVRVASDPWIRGIIRSKGQAEEILEKIKQICSDNMRDNGNISQGTGRRYYQDFPYDGQVLHPSRITSMVNAHEKIRYSKGWEAYLSERDIDDLKKIKTLLERLQETGKMESGEKRLGFGEPERYYAILIADGDRMGKTISDPSMKTSKDHFRFSSKLARFAGIARKIVKRQHGCMVFSGGDDVLAFLPLDSCLQAARRLHYAFSTLLKRYPDEKGNPPTLSVGIAIVHSMEPLEDMLNFGRDAKNAAKRGKIAQDERDGLAIHLHPRSGVPIRIREQWRSKGKDGLDERLLRWSDMLISDQLPDAAAYDLHELAEDYRDWKVHSEEEKNGLAELIHADAWRLLKRKKADQRRGAPKGVTEKHFEEMLEDINSFEAISGLANELIVARRLAAAMIQARGRPLSEAKDQEVISS